MVRRATAGRVDELLGAGVLPSAEVLAELVPQLADAPLGVRQRLEPALVGLGYVAAGGRFAGDHTAAGGRRLLGWTARHHWMLLPSARG